MPSTYITLPRTENQARLLGQFALDFLAGKHGEPEDGALAQVELFHLDSIGCAVSAIACGANAPTVFRTEARTYPDPHGAPLLGSNILVAPEKAVVANSAAAREWDANGTNFGHNPRLGHSRGEFGHNDFYPVVLAAAHQRGLNGRQTLKAMLLLDEIRGRLAEVFSLKTYKIDHVVHGGIASATVYGALMGATPEQIESAIGLLVAHYVPFRAIRHGKQLADSKGASAAMQAEMAVLAVRRAMRGFAGPADIFRNPEAIFCLFEEPAGIDQSPFDLTLTVAGSDFAVMGMHFKLGLYEHQSAGAIQGLMDLLAAHPQLADDPAKIHSVRITIYEPAFQIIGDHAKRDPRTRQSADHSMVYIIATLLRKARDCSSSLRDRASECGASMWRELMLMPPDYEEASLMHPLTRQLMSRIEFRHGGPAYDARYPDGIPTTLEIEHADLGRVSSGLVMYPLGHARNTSHELPGLLEYKFRKLASLGVVDVDGLCHRFSNLSAKSPAEMAALLDFELRSWS